VLGLFIVITGVNMPPRKRYSPPPVHIRFSFDPAILSGGWFALIGVVCTFTSRNGKTYEIHADLKANVAMRLTDHLLHPHRIPDDFMDTPSERYRLSRNIANQLKALTWGTSRKEWLRRRGYPTQFKAYAKPAKSAR
jgi:hypothetical protein